MSRKYDITFERNFKNKFKCYENGILNGYKT